MSVSLGRLAYLPARAARSRGPRVMVGVRASSLVCAAGPRADGPAAGSLDAPPTASRTIPDQELQVSAGLTARDVKRMDRLSWLAVAAARAALREAGLAGPALAACGIVTGNMLGGWTSTEPQLRGLHQLDLSAVSPYLASAWFPAAAQGQITIRLGLRGFAKTIATDRCAGAHAIGMALTRVEDHPQEAMLAGGAEAPVTPFVRAAYARRGDDPDVLAEGAAYVVLTANDDAPIHVVGHESFTLPSQGSGRADVGDRLALAVDAMGPRAVPTLVFANVAPRAREEDGIESAVAQALPGVGYELFLPNRAIGETLAASGPLATVLACRAITDRCSRDTALVVSVGADHADVLCLATTSTRPRGAP